MAMSEDPYILGKNKNTVPENNIRHCISLLSNYFS